VVSSSITVVSGSFASAQDGGISAQVPSQQASCFIAVPPPPQLVHVFDGISSFQSPLLASSPSAGMVKVRGSDRHFSGVPLSAINIMGSGVAFLGTSILNFPSVSAEIVYFVSSDRVPITKAKASVSHSTTANSDCCILLDTFPVRGVIEVRGKSLISIFAD